MTSSIQLCMPQVRSTKAPLSIHLPAQATSIFTWWQCFSSSLTVESTTMMKCPSSQWEHTLTWLRAIYGRFLYLKCALERRLGICSITYWTERSRWWLWHYTDWKGHWRMSIPMCTLIQTPIHRSRIETRLSSSALKSHQSSVATFTRWWRKKATCNSSSTQRPRTQHHLAEEWTTRALRCMGQVSEQPISHSASTNIKARNLSVTQMPHRRTGSSATWAWELEVWQQVWAKPKLHRSDSWTTQTTATRKFSASQLQSISMPACNTLPAS